MKLWMLPWLLPVGLLGAVVFVVVFNRAAPLIAAGLGVVVMPLLWRIRSDWGAPGGRGADDPETHYWRFKRP
jgi:hypothetical protein